MDGSGGCFVVLFVVALGIFVLYQWGKANQAEAERAARKAREEYEDWQRRYAEWEKKEAERQRDLAEQAQFNEQLLTMNEESLSALEAMPINVETAETYLDQAETDFAEGAFAPFWDSVERAAVALAGFDQRVRTIDNVSSKYLALVKKYRGQAPVFAVSAESMPKLKIASETSKRMNGIVRKAQRNFQFSTIYEQRKTNQILVAGFKSLAQALEEMTWRISSSIDGLTSSVSSMSSTLNDSLLRIHEQIYEQTEKIADTTAGLREDVAKEAAGRSEREKVALEMLDNIQRKRYPGFLYGGLR